VRIFGSYFTDTPGLFFVAFDEVEKGGFVVFNYLKRWVYQAAGTGLLPFVFETHVRELYFTDLGVVSMDEVVLSVCDIETVAEFISDPVPE
jgi:hypothetical protein